MNQENELLTFTLNVKTKNLIKISLKSLKTLASFIFQVKAVMHLKNRQEEIKKIEKMNHYVSLALQEFSRRESCYTFLIIDKLTGKKLLKSQNVLSNTVYRKPEKKANRTSDFVWLQDYDECNFYFMKK